MLAVASLEKLIVLNTHHQNSALRLLTSDLRRPMRPTFLPFALPHTDEAESAEVADAIRSG